MYVKEFASDDLRGFLVESNAILLCDSDYVVKGCVKKVHDLTVKMEEHVRTLEEEMKEKSLSYADAVIFAHDVIAGINHMHGLGLIHCDVKVDNVMITENRRAVLIDFNITQMWREMGSSAACTLEYRPPEIEYDGDPVPARICPRVDVYSAGILMYFMRYGIKKGLVVMRECNMWYISELFGDESHRCSRPCSREWLYSLGDDDYIRLLRMKGDEYDALIVSMIRARPQDRIDSAEAMRKIGAMAAQFLPGVAAPVEPKMAPTRAEYTSKLLEGGADPTAVEVFTGLLYDEDDPDRELDEDLVEPLRELLWRDRLIAAWREY